MDLFVFLIVYIAFYIISIPIHELGHLVFGLLTGSRFSSFRLLSLVWYKENGKLLFKKSGTRFMLGQCLMAPPAREADFRFVLYNLGGGIFNLLTVAVLFGIAVLTGGLCTALLAGIIASAVTALMNLIPMTVQVPNDGMNVVKALQSPEARHGLYVMMLVNEQMMYGKRFRDYDDRFFTLPEHADLRNHFTAYILICDAARLYDGGEYDACIEKYDALNLDKLPAYFKNSVRLDYLYHYCVHRPDFDKARELYAQRGMKRYLEAPLPMITRTRAAYEFFVCGDREKAAESMKKAKVQAESFPNKGIQLMEQDYLDHLEILMQNSR